MRTLSGGDCGAMPGGTPTAWKIESMLGIATMPATVTETGPAPGRWRMTVSPRPTWRFAAVWVKIIGPSAEPLSNST